MTNTVKHGQLICVSGLAGAGKTTLIAAALERVDNLRALVSYTTRPRRAGEEHSREYVFLNDAEYDEKERLSRNWDEIRINGNRYGADADVYIRYLCSGSSIIVSVAPKIDIVREMERVYHTRPVTIWINTDPETAKSRVAGDLLRSQRNENGDIKEEFDIVFDPTGNLPMDVERFVNLIKELVLSR